MVVGWFGDVQITRNYRGIIPMSELDESDKQIAQDEASAPFVLIVDDNIVDQRVAGANIETGLGWSIAYAGDGNEALAAMAVKLPDVVLTDLQMPNMDGLELVGAIRSSYPSVPVVLMTAFGNEKIAMKALELGAASYVPKLSLHQDLAATPPPDQPERFTRCAVGLRR